MSDDCRGKASWPELVGARGVDAASTIERENPYVTAEIVLEGTIVTQEFSCTRAEAGVGEATGRVFFALSRRLCFLCFLGYGAYWIKRPGGGWID
ncbi:hypothetical protein Dsin_029815 [Dipteronia sinensis]|uniref:Uncharacterized protein n=1 Tax=Dipteronia sinensis TaxID=43782 RepID=A0AAE0DVX0_9ROSI|nr:hypothetical protein Dsin_029815 [Dipteronia sinensis]